MADGAASPSVQLPSEARQPSSAATAAPLLRLCGLSTTQLPPPSAPASILGPFLTALLNEAVPLVTSAAAASSSSSSFPSSSSAPPEQVKAWKSKGTKRLPASDAPVSLTERVIAYSHPTPAAPATAMTAPAPTDTWACRHSVHADAARKGTAAWGEFEHWVRDEHAAAEEAFTPAVLGHRVVAQWEGEEDDENRLQAAVGEIQIGGGGHDEGSAWHGFRILLVEMKHKLPAPLQPRVFPVVQVIASSSAAAAAAAGGDGDGRGAGRGEREGQSGAHDDAFLVISIPLADWPPRAGKSAEWAVAAAAASGCLAAEKGVVVGRYVSVEKVVRRRRRQRAKRDTQGAGEQAEEEEEEGEGRVIEWTMATASDARGVLPLWVQTKAVPGQIAKDVGLFLGWVDGKRGGNQ